MRIQDSGSQAQEKGDSENHGLQDPCVHVAFWVLNKISRSAGATS